MPSQIPIDPKLPKNFNDTPNGKRSKEELDRWWDHPYCTTSEHGFDVHCLNGGAWDRASWLGRAKTYREACELADKKQSAWVKQREGPVVAIDGLPGPCHLILQNHHPHREDEVIGTFATLGEANKYLDQLREQEPEDED